MWVVQLLSIPKWVARAEACLNAKKEKKKKVMSVKGKASEGMNTYHTIAKPGVRASECVHNDIHLARVSNKGRFDPGTSNSSVSVYLPHSEPADRSNWGGNGQAKRGFQIYRTRKKNLASALVLSLQRVCRQLEALPT
jgi:hypothetical protein